MSAAVRFAILDLVTDHEDSIINGLISHYRSGEIDLHFVSHQIGQLTYLRNLVHSLEAEARQSAVEDYGKASEAGTG